MNCCYCNLPCVKMEPDELFSSFKESYLCQNHKFFVKNYTPPVQFVGLNYSFPCIFFTKNNSLYRIFKFSFYLVEYVKLKNTYTNPKEIPEEFFQAYNHSFHIPINANLTPENVEQKIPFYALIK